MKIRLTILIIILSISLGKTQINLHRGFDQLFVLPFTLAVVDDTIKTYSTVGVPYSQNNFSTIPYVASFDTAGNVIDSFYTANLNDFFQATEAVFDKNGDMILSGIFTKTATGLDTNTGIFIQKWRANQKIWTRKFQDTLPYIDYLLNDIVVTESGLIAMVGFLELEGDSIQPGNPGFPDSDLLFMLCDSNGTLLQLKRIGDNTAQENGLEISLGSDSTFVISSNSNFPNSPDFKRLLITDYYGNIIKDYYIQGARILDAIETSDDGYVYTSYLSNSSGLKATIHKLDSNMNPIWTTVFEKPFVSFHNTMNRIREDENGNLYVAGNQSGLFFDPDTAGQYGFLAKLSPNGDSLWGKYYGIIDYSTLYDSHIFNDLILNKDKIYILGFVVNTTGSINPAQQLWLVSVDTNGCPHPDCIVGMDDQIEQNFGVRVVPNPNNGKLRFQLEGGQDSKLKLRIFEPKGTEVYQNYQYKNGQMVNLHNLKSGLYFYLLESKESLKRGKLIIKE